MRIIYHDLGLSVLLVILALAAYVDPDLQRNG